MVEEPVFRGIIEFFGKVGVYDVVLPFLLVFTIVFAILEKTRIFGVDKVGEVEYSKKNINAMVAFVIAFFVIASTRLVALISEAMANIVILLLISVSFLLLIGSFYKEGEAVALEKAWRTMFMILMFVGVTLIFLHGIKTEDGESWLEIAWFWIIDNWSSNAAGSIILVLIVIGAIIYVQYEPRRGAEKSSEDKK